PPPSSSGGNGLLWGGVAAALLGGAGYYLYATNDPSTKTTGVFKPKWEDYQKVYDAVAKKLIDDDQYDDGSYGPVLLRLAWHASGTYDKETGTGGSNGATMRFPPEGDHGANAGLKAARDFLEPLKKQFPWISYSDLWILAGICAVQEMGGPDIPFRPGRQDRDIGFCTPDGRLPDASRDQKHLRDIFGRMGFNDQEIVALSGAHALGRCHTDRSGYDGPWTFSPITLTNDYYKLLLDEKWDWRKWNGPKQYEDKSTKSLMMLPTDVSLIKDKSFKSTVQRYAKDQDEFFKDFSNVLVKLFELGVPFGEDQTERKVFK
ncbi:class II peroxidase, partial [Piedraia hortae CBS 480.64]